MKDKRNILKLACLIEVIYMVVLLISYLLNKKFNDEVIASLFMLVISMVVTIILYKESKKDIEYIKNNKIKTLLCSIWLFFDPIIPGILGFIFLSLISDKKKNSLPEVSELPNSKKNFIKSLILICFFMIIMFILPLFNFFKNIPIYLVYLFIFVIVLLINFTYLKNDFKVFIKNIKSYLPFIIKRYLIMLGCMVIVAIPIVFLNNGNVSSNQQVLNTMFKKIPVLMLVLSCFYAPFVEENIFRLSLSKIFKNKTLFIIISGVLFGTLHMIDKFTSFYDLLYIFQYSALGICLAKAYSDSKNIFVSISMHFIQNFIAALLVLLLY